MSPRALVDAAEPRAARTMQKLTDALMLLLTREELAEVTVTELCREAGVHRTTFYGHFAGVENLAAAVFAGLIDDLSVVSLAADHTESAREISRTYVETLENLLTRVAESRPVYRALFSAQFSGGFRAQLTARMQHRVQLAFDEWRVRDLAFDVDPTLASAYVAGGLVGAIEAWTASDETDAVEFARKVLALMPPWWPRPGAPQ